jgi:hypothetical protein
LVQDIETYSDDVTLLRASLEARPHLFSSTPVFVTHTQIASMQGIIRAVEDVVSLPAWREQALSRAPEIARIDLGVRGVFLGYDFHLGPDGAQLIEINTNAGGGLFNALLGQAQLDCCQSLREQKERSTRLPDLERVYLEMFRAEWRIVRGSMPLAILAIVDDAPTEQYLYPEFVLFQNMFRRHGLRALIADAAALEFRGGALWQGDTRIDMVYNRLTDFYLKEPRHAALHAAYQEGSVVLTPHPRAHALYADKRNLVQLSDPDFLRALDLPAATVETLIRGIPRTVRVDAAHAETLWAARRRYFFKPAAGYGSKAAYRGDKLTKRVWSEILGADYVAQETVPPSERALHVNGDTRDLKLDIRAYVYDGAIQALAARLYQGQTTNFRTPGGGFAPVVVVPENAATTFAAWPDATGHDFEFSNL